MTNRNPEDAGSPRPHHFMNADGFCHAGDMFEAGTAWIGLYAADALAKVWDEGYLRAVEPRSDVRDNPYRTCVLPPGGGREGSSR